MVLLKNILKNTPFYKRFLDYKRKKYASAQKKIELELHPLRVNFYKTFINPGDLVFDVGANVGNRVHAFLDCKATVVAVEPQLSCVEILKDKFGETITIANIGLSNQLGELQMHIASDSTVSSFSTTFIDRTKERFKHSKWNETVTVPISTLDNLVAKYGIPKFCKIDVEGWELEVIKGLNHQIPMLSVEYCVPEMHEQLLECVNKLHKLSASGMFNYCVTESMQWALSEWLNHNEFINHINSVTFQKTLFGDFYFKTSISS